MFKMDLKNYYLDLKKVSELELEDERKIIHDYYRDMLSYNYEKRDEIATSMFNTLYSGDYLKEVRDEKIDQILS